MSHTKLAAMFRYLYSALILAVTKPACDYIIRMLTKSTDAKIDGATAELVEHLRKLLADEGFDALREEVHQLVLKNSNDVQAAETRMLIANCHDEITKSRNRKLSPVKGTSSELIKIVNQQKMMIEEISEVRKLVVDKCGSEVTVFDSAELEKIQSDVVELHKLVEACQKDIVKSRIAAHDDAMSLHNEHVQMHKAIRT